MRFLFFIFFIFAGSDLDGDEYHVMWYEDFIFSRDNEPAMHYAMHKDKSQEQNDKIKVNIFLLCIPLFTVPFFIFCNFSSTRL